MGLFQPAMWSFTRPATYNPNWKLQRYISLCIGSLFLDCLTKAQQQLGAGWTNAFEKYSSKLESSPIFGVKIRHVWKHHPEKKRVFWEISMCNTAKLWQNQGTSNFSKKMIKHFHLNMHLHVLPHGCWTKNSGILPPKWMVYFMENPMNKWMILGIKKTQFLGWHST